MKLGTVRFSEGMVELFPSAKSLSNKLTEQPSSFPNELSSQSTSAFPLQEALINKQFKVALNYMKAPCSVKELKKAWAILKDPKLEGDLEKYYTLRASAATRRNKIESFFLSTKRFLEKNKALLTPLRQLEIACFFGHSEEVSSLLKESNQGLPIDLLRIALNRKQPEIAIQLLESGRINPSDEGNFAIHLAIKEGYRKVAERLFQDPRVTISQELEEWLRKRGWILTKKLSSG